MNHVIAEHQRVDQTYRAKYWICSNIQRELLRPAYVPSLHWYHSRRLAWFDVADGLPRYHGLDSDGEEPYRHGPATEGLPAGT